MSTSRRLSKIVSTLVNNRENELSERLINFHSKNIKPYYTILPATSLQRYNEKKIRALIRRAVQESYLAGLEIVGHARKNMDIFISSTDIQNIQNISKEMEFEYWKTTDKLVSRATEYVVNKDSLQLKNQFDTDAALRGVSAFLSWRSYNRGLISKMQEISIKQSAGAKRLAKSRITKIQITRFEGPITEEEANWVRWETMEDSIVCTPQTNSWHPCSIHDQEIFNVHDPDLPEMPWHRWCRCRLVPLVESPF